MLSNSAMKTQKSIWLWAFEAAVVYSLQQGQKNRCFGRILKWSELTYRVTTNREARTKEQIVPNDHAKTQISNLECCLPGFRRGAIPLNNAIHSRIWYLLVWIRNFTLPLKLSKSQPILNQGSLVAGLFEGPLLSRQQQIDRDQSSGYVRQSLLSTSWSFFFGLWWRTFTFGA